MRRLIAVGLALLVAGCAAASDDGRPSVVTGFYPLQFVAQRVGGDRVRVTDLAQPGAEPHDLELRPRQVGAIADATLLLSLRGFQPAVDEAADQSGVAVLDVAGVVPLHSDDDHGGADWHLWLDPTKLAAVGTALADRLAALDPAGADGYHQRSSALAAELAELDTAFADGLRSCARREIVVSHDAFGYLTDRYGLHQIAIAGVSPDTEPTPRQLASAAEQARAAGATTIFFEPLVSPAVARTVAQAAGARAAVLDPVEGLEPGSAGDYVSVMRANLATLRSALECS